MNVLDRAADRARWLLTEEAGTVEAPLFASLVLAVDNLPTASRARYLRRLLYALDVQSREERGQ